jgi:regulator of Ty1 transposition protein 103
MAFTDDIVLAKLSSLNETQESIATVGGWLCHHKYVTLKRTCQSQMRC